METAVAIWVGVINLDFGNRDIRPFADSRDLVAEHLRQTLSRQLDGCCQVVDRRDNRLDDKLSVLLDFRGVCECLGHLVLLVVDEVSLGRRIVILYLVFILFIHLAENRVNPLFGGLISGLGECCWVRGYWLGELFQFSKSCVYICSLVGRNSGG
jgi:hypothetical protein